MDIIGILKIANTDRILRSQIFVIGRKAGLKREDIRNSIEEAKRAGLKEREVIISELDENYMPFNSTKTECYVSNKTTL